MTRSKANLTPPYAAMGLSYDAVEPDRFVLPVYESDKTAIAAGGPDLGLNLCSHVSTCNNLALRYYLIGDQGRAERYGREVVPAALDYFFGPWRSHVETDEGTIDPSWWYDQEDWIDPFRFALCWGSLLGQLAEVKQLAAYPNEQRSKEESGINKKPALRQLMLELAAYLRNDALGGSVAERVKASAGAEWRGMGSLAAALDGIVRGDAAIVSDRVNDGLRAVKTTKTKDVTEMMGIEATIIWQLALRARLHVQTEPTLERYLIHITA
jgi:hypothetical protein